MGIEDRQPEHTADEFWPPSKPRAGEIDITEHPDAESVATNNRMRVYASYVGAGENRTILIRTVSHDDYKRGTSVDFTLAPDNKAYSMAKGILDEAK